MTISADTTLVELEVVLRAFGLMVTCSLERDGNVIAVVTDTDAVTGAACAKTIARALHDAVETYKFRKTSRRFG